jgi:hypothetical protein
MPQLNVAFGRCQFCHAQASQDDLIIAGDSAFICDDCVRKCARLLEEQPQAAQPGARDDRYVHQRLSRHFAPLPLNELHATARTFSLRQQADLQLALDALLGERRIPENFLGTQGRNRHEAAVFSRLVDRDRGAVEIAPAQYEEIDIGGDQSVRCLRNGVWLLNPGDLPAVVVLTQQDDYSGGGTLSVEVATPPGEAGAALCSRLFNEIEKRLSTSSCYRGRVLSLEQPNRWAGDSQRIRVHELDAVTRDEVILAEETLRTVERNVLTFARQRAALRSMGLSTQKGLLFHGPPGTGKTHCIRYLSGQLADHTTLLITAEQAGLLASYMSLARLLQPSLVVIEDADLIARNRDDMGSACDEVLLNQLLNELDGLRERADVFFILTTNRPEMLEAALASRPGRVDQAIEFALPDAAHRHRLISLYARGLTIPSALGEELAKRTDGASPAFIKELMRRVAQHQLEGNHSGAVSRETAEAALHEMLFSGGVLNSRLLGGKVSNKA